MEMKKMHKYSYKIYIFPLFFKIIYNIILFKYILFKIYLKIFNKQNSNYYILIFYI